MPYAINIQNLRFQWPGQPTETLSIKELIVPEGEKVFIHGESGSGKSTLLNIISGVLKAQSDKLEILNTQYSQLKQGSLDQFRSDNIGYIFQNFNLLPYLNVRENISLPLNFSEQRLKNIQHNTVEDAIEELTSSLQLHKNLLNQPVNKLSIGQQQRVAVARALIGHPKLVIADEPTSSLDAATKNSFIELLLKQSTQSKTTLLFVSHDLSLHSNFDRSIELSKINEVTP